MTDSLVIYANEYKAVQDARDALNAYRAYVEGLSATAYHLQRDNITDMLAMLDRELDAAVNALNDAQEAGGKMRNLPRVDEPIAHSTWKSAMEQRDRDFNRRYYNNDEGKPEWSYNG